MIDPDFTNPLGSRFWIHSELTEFAHSHGLYNYIGFRCIDCKDVDYYVLCRKDSDTTEGDYSRYLIIESTAKDRLEECMKYVHAYAVTVK